MTSTVALDSRTILITSYSDDYQQTTVFCDDDPKEVRKTNSTEQSSCSFTKKPGMKRYLPDIQLDWNDRYRWN